MPTEYWFEEGCWITELSNTDADPALSVARARVPVDGTTRWHRLDGIVERYVIVDGEGLVSIGDEPARKVTAGDVVTIPSMTAQRIQNTSDVDLVFLAICTPRFRPECYQDIDHVVA